MKINYKEYLPIILLIASYQVGEMHTFFDWKSESFHNWILFVSRPMNTAWNVKFLSEETCRVLEATAFYIIAKRGGVKIFIVTAQVYLVYRCLDIGFYFLTYKTKWYNWIWVLLAVVEIWLNYKSKEKHYIYKYGRGKTA